MELLSGTVNVTGTDPCDVIAAQEADTSILVCSVILSNGGSTGTKVQVLNGSDVVFVAYVAAHSTLPIGSGAALFATGAGVALRTKSLTGSVDLDVSAFGLASDGSRTAGSV